MMGAGLYRRLMSRAVATAKGEAVEADWIRTPSRELIFTPGSLASRPWPRSMNSKRNLRTTGSPPVQISTLLALARMRRLAKAGGVRQMDAGLKGIAIAATKINKSLMRSSKQLGFDARAKDGRIVVGGAFGDREERLATVERLLEAMGA
jgi:hypothetical protein